MNETTYAYLACLAPREENEAYVFSMPAFPGLHCAGDTLEEAIGNLPDAFALHIEDDALPEPAAEHRYDADCEGVPKESRYSVVVDIADRAVIGVRSVSAVEAAYDVVEWSETHNISLGRRAVTRGTVLTKSIIHTPTPPNGMDKVGLLDKIAKGKYTVESVAMSDIAKFIRGAGRAYVICRKSSVSVHTEALEQPSKPIWRWETEQNHDGYSWVHIERDDVGGGMALRELEAIAPYPLYDKHEGHPEKEGWFFMFKPHVVEKVMDGIEVSLGYFPELLHPDLKSLSTGFDLISDANSIGQTEDGRMVAAGINMPRGEGNYSVLLLERKRSAKVYVVSEDRMEVSPELKAGIISTIPHILAGA